MKKSDYKISRYGDGLGIFENGPDKTKNRLLLLAHPDGSYDPGPGLGTETVELIDAIPTTLVLDALAAAKNIK